MEYTIGSVVFDGWTIVRELGEGGFGKVYEVRNNKGNIETASALKVIRIPRSVSDVKYIRSQGMDDQSVTDYFHGFVDRLVKEIAAMSKLKDHPNIVRYEDHQVLVRAGEFGWDILIRMELLTPFPDYYMEHGISQEEVCRLGKEMCSALIFCHQQGIIHRDVKPSNIFVNSLGIFKLGDFGVSRTMGKSTGTGRQGTESYMAPEVYLNRHYGASVDIYSLGMLLYQLANGGRLPFYPPPGQIVGYGDEDIALKRRMDGEAFPPPVGASSELSQIILKACAYNPADRYPDGQALLGALNQLNFSTEPLITPKNKTISFMDMVNRSQDPTATEPVVMPTPSALPSTEPVLPPVSLEQKSAGENQPSHSQTKSPFDQFGGQPTSWQANPLSQGQEGPTSSEGGTTPIAKAAVPMNNADKTEPGRAAMAAQNQGTGAGKTTPNNQTPFPQTEKKTGGLKPAVGIFIGIAAVIAVSIGGIAFAINRIGGDDHTRSPSQTTNASKDIDTSSHQSASSEVAAPPHESTSVTLVRQVELLFDTTPGAGVAAVVPLGGTVEIVEGEEYPDQWLKVTYNDDIGFVKAPLLTTKDVGILTRSEPELCDQDGNVVGTAPTGAAVTVLGYTARDWRYWYQVEYNGQTFYVDENQLTLSEALTDARKIQDTTRLSLTRTTAQPSGSPSWSALTEIEPNTTLQMYQSLLPGWYIIPVDLSADNSRVYYYVEAIAFQNYWDQAFLAASHEEDMRVWNGCYNINNLTVPLSDWSQPTSTDIAMMTLWEQVQKNLTQTLRLGSEAPDYKNLSQEDFAAFFNNAVGFYPPSNGNGYFYYWEGNWDRKDGDYSDSIHFTRQRENWFSAECKAVIERNEDGSVPDMGKEQREREKINSVALLPEGISLGMPREEVLNQLGVTDQMLEWAEAYRDCLLYWNNVSESINGAESRYGVCLFSNGNFWVNGGLLNGDFHFSFDEDGNLSGFSVETKTADLTFPEEFDRAGS